MTFQAVDVQCPECGRGEVNPATGKLFIRSHKVHVKGSWWSQCLVCAGYYDKNLQVAETPPENWQADGWFRSTPEEAE